MAKRKDWEPENLRKISTPAIAVRANVSSHTEIKHIVGRTNIKGKTRITEAGNN